MKKNILMSASILHLSLQLASLLMILKKKIAKYTGTKYAVATSNGTSALHISLILADTDKDSEVITQPLTFVATCNAISYCNATPIFVDVDIDTMGLSPQKLRSFLEKNTIVKNKQCINNKTKKVIIACVPMHSYGHPCKIDEIKDICDQHSIFLIEDAAESLGSFYKDKHTGTFGDFGAISFNGNKIITTGGGGMVLCKTLASGQHTKHITTTAKVPHPYEFFHDEPGFNYRMPNINAALGCAQMETLGVFLDNKRQLANLYVEFFRGSEFKFVTEPSYAKSNYWLNAIICPNQSEREKLLKQTNADGVMTRPIWQLMHRLPMFEKAMKGDLSHSEYIEAHLVNIPSSPVESLGKL